MQRAKIKTETKAASKHECVCLVAVVGSPTNALLFTIFKENSLESDQAVEPHTWKRLQT